MEINIATWRPWGFPGDSVVKNLLASAGDVSLIPSWGTSPGEENDSQLSIPPWEIPWTEKLGGLQSMGSQKSWTRLSNWTTRRGYISGDPVTPKNALIVFSFKALVSLIALLLKHFCAKHHLFLENPFLEYWMLHLFARSHPIERNIRRTILD